MKVVRLYSDSQGETHFDEVEVPLTAVNFAPPAPPINPTGPARPQSEDGRHSKERQREEPRFLTGLDAGDEHDQLG